MKVATPSRALELLLEDAPDRAQAARYLDRFRAEAPEVFERISDSPVTLRYLVTTFAYSTFLAEEVVKNPDWLLDVAQSKDLHRVVSEEEYIERLLLFLGSGEGVPAALSLARFRRRQILRIMLRDVLGLGSLSDVTEELSNLSDSIVEVAYRAIRRDLEKLHGRPSCGMAVIALGKLGAKELNYSSDIDLMFVYGANGETRGPEPVTYKEFYKKLSNQLTALLSTYTREGLCYRVDLRLRPDGTLGEICLSLDGAKEYYKSRARDWELQMLIKGRVSAGDRAVGRELLDFVEPMIYRTTLDFRAVEAVSESRQRIGEKVAARKRRTGIDVKLSPGGIRDLEFLVQCLQRLHGGREPWLRHAGTLLALFRLRDKGLLSGSEYSRLASAYQFFRHVEHRLQFLDDRQTHEVPLARADAETLARKIPHDASRDAYTAATLAAEIARHQSEVCELYERVIHAQRPMYDSAPWPGDAEPAAESPDAAAVWSSNLIRFLEVKAPGLASMLARSPIPRNRDRFEHFLEKLVAEPAMLGRFESDAPLAARAIDLFAHSQFFADQLLRMPEQVFQLQGQAAVPAMDDPASLRRWFWLEMIRVQARSIHERVPIFQTLEETSDVADRVIAEAYRMALAQKDAGRPPRMSIIALGRLGMREFDLASDADLVFVIPDSESEQTRFWTSTAERIIDIASAYTGDGVMFSVDTRLRPNGREGALVQTAQAVKDYFATRAEAWEGISYMKARAIAGDVEWGTQFLNDLQEVDWRRYGQSGRSKPELAAMRQRLEKEQGARNPLKAGRGGYYDIDFALMYLRLKGAGIFFKHLNTPQRIEVVEKMGHLDRDDAVFLQEAAAFYRAIDHGMRVWSGHAEGKLPTAAAQLDVLTRMVRRWTPAVLGEERLGVKVQEIRTRTRDLFSRVFR